MEILVLRLMILKLIIDTISERLRTPDNKLCEHFESKNKRRSLSEVKFKKFKTLPYRGRCMLNLNEIINFQKRIFNRF